ncbi:hypothetical protein M6B38_368695 [Iris pallida]|uniref:Uncharacterized protein n=1 Tax=Iris pallida TaxID=29817 RepID=A0AAX6EQW9_IRIPA|nr:hypothetical protein M6B38_175970 [Iris pallida]KAJ6827416.1 hypothetical protein M6B38_368695 [Iris pallida]
MVVAMAMYGGGDRRRRSWRVGGACGGVGESAGLVVGLMGCRTQEIHIL